MDFNKIIVAILLIFATTCVHSQDVSQEIFTRYYLLADYKFSNWVIDPFEKVVSYDIGYRLNYGKYFTDISYKHYHGVSNPASLSSVNAKRQYDLHVNTYTFGLGMNVINTDKKINLAPYFNLNFGDPIRIHSTSVYADGFASYGSENDYNGTYMDAGTLGIELGLLLKFKIFESFALECKVSKMWINYDNSNDRTLDDKSLYKAFTSNAGIDSQVIDKLAAFKVALGISYTFQNNKD